MHNSVIYQLYFIDMEDDSEFAIYFLSFEFLRALIIAWLLNWSAKHLLQKPYSLS